MANRLKLCGCILLTALFSLHVIAQETSPLSAHAQRYLGLRLKQRTARQGQSRSCSSNHMERRAVGMN